MVQETRLAYNRSFIFQSDPRENTNFSIEKELGIPNIPAAGQTNGFPAGLRSPAIHRSEI